MSAGGACTAAKAAEAGPGRARGGAEQEGEHPHAAQGTAQANADRLLISGIFDLLSLDHS